MHKDRFCGVARLNAVWVSGWFLFFKEGLFVKPEQIAS